MLSKFQVKTQFFDERSLLAVQAARIGLLNQPFIALTLTGTSRAWFAFAFALNALHLAGIRISGNQVELLRALYCPLVAWGVSTFVKRWFARKRPRERLVALQPLIETPVCGSFPSGHAAASFSFFVALAIFGHPWAPFVGLWTLLVSFSRIYLGVHYASDVVGGFALGAICAVGVLAILR